MDGQPDLLLHLVEHRCVARWQQHGPQVRPWSRRWVSVGQLAQPDGRWYVHQVAQVHRPVSLHPGQAEAMRAARGLMDHLGGDWRQVPCYPTDEAVRRREPGG